MKSIRMFTLVIVFLSLGLGNVFANSDTLSCQAMFGLKQDFEALVENNQMIIHLTDYSSSSEEINSWNWDFGDGTTSTEQNPSHTYSNAGAYVVTLKITTNQYTSRNDHYFMLFDLETYNKKKEEPDCHAAFDYFYDASENEDSASATIIFTDTSFSKSVITNWLWDFGDETTSTEQNPTHTYSQNRIYEVLLVVYSENGSDTTSRFVYINVPETPIEPVACQSAFSYSIYADSSNGSLVIDYYTITFHDMSSSPNEITGWLWEFGDGNTSTEQYPEHTYSTEGEYEVKLTIYSEDCESSVINPMPIHENSWNNNEEVPACQASFVHGISIDSIAMEPVVDFKTVSFFDISTSHSEITNWLWNFGDGSTSTEQNPIHTYSSEGDYEVELTIYSDDCENSTMNVIIIDESQWNNNEEEVPACQAEFVYGNKIDTISMEPVVDFKTIYFLDISTSPDNITSWLWNFGDGTTSTEQYTTHTYAEEGEFIVELTIKSDQCESTVSNIVFIEEPSTVEETPVCEASFVYRTYVDSTNSVLTYDPYTILFFDRSKSSEIIVEWLWDFGDGNISTEQYPVHTYAKTGTYTVTLTFVAEDCDGSIAQDITINNNTKSTDSHNEATSVISFENNIEHLTIYPNPVKANSTINFYSENQNSTLIQIFNLSGKKVLSKKISTKPGQNQILLDASTLENGQYIIRMNNSKESIKFIKK